MRAPRINPALPRLQVNQVHAGQKWSAIKLRCGIGLSVLHRGVEIMYVGAHAGSCANFLGGYFKPVCAQLGAQLVKSLAECMTGVLAVRLGPENGDRTSVVEGTGGELAGGG